MVQMAEAISDTVKSHLGSIGDIREYRICHIPVNRLHDALHQLLAQPFTFLIDVTVRAPAEIDTLKGAGTVLLGRKYLFKTLLSTLTD